jgi:hypothetical protein
MLEKAPHAGKIDQRVARLAARQYGHVTRAQLLRLGMHRRTISRRLDAGSLIRVHAGVYAVGHLREDPVARAMAAVLACGPNAVLSHHSAAALWGFRKWYGGPVHVTAPTLHRRRGIKAHRRPLTRREIRRHQGIPVTTPARTLLDIARDLPEKQLIRAINDALVAECLKDRHLHGTRLECYVGELSRSPLEDDVKPWIKRFDLPEPLYNAKIGGYEADVYYPEAKLIVELDGWRFHRTKKAFEDDRERDAYMLARGIATIRITRARLANAPAKEAGRLRQIYDSRVTLTDL